MDFENFIFCLEGVDNIQDTHETEAYKNLTALAEQQGISSIYKTCDSIEGMVESLEALLHTDAHFGTYEIIYLVMEGEANSICLDGYYYSIEEIAELFEGRLKGKVLHFANEKALDLSSEEAQYFLDITRAKAISGYGAKATFMRSHMLDKEFFSLFEESDDVIEIVEGLYKKHYAACKALDFRLYY